MPPDLDPLSEILSSPPPRSAPTTSHLNDLIDFAKENNLMVGSTTGGTHNAGSKHYSGNAFDARGSGLFSNTQVNDLKKKAAERGILLRDERQRPPGQKVWGGPHVHFEFVGGQSSDPLSEMMSAPPSDDPLADVTSQVPGNFRVPDVPTVKPGNSIYATGQQRARTGTTGAPRPSDPFALLKAINAQPSPPSRDDALRERAIKNTESITVDPVANLKFLYGAATKGIKAQFDAEAENEFQNLKAAEQRATTPQMISARKFYGSMVPLPGQPNPRAIIQPLVRTTAGLMKLAAGTWDIGGLFSEDDISKYIRTKARFIDESASLPPLNAAEEEVKRKLPEKTVAALMDTGLGIAEIIVLKKATGIQSLSRLLALETALKTTGEPMAKRISQVAESALMGKVLDRHLSRPASALLFGGPTAVRQGQSYIQGDTSLEDAILQTAVQSGVGFALGGKRKTAMPEIPDVPVATISKPRIVKGVVPEVPTVAPEPLPAEAASAASTPERRSHPRAEGLEVFSGEQRARIRDEIINARPEDLENMKRIMAGAMERIAQPPAAESSPSVRRGTSDAAPVAESPSVREGAVVKPWEMTRSEIESEFERKKAEDDNLEISVLGPELAKRYARLQRSANSSYDTEKANAASDEIEKIEASLSETDRNRLYGIGETGLQVDEWRDYQRSLSNLDDSDPQSLAESMRWAVSRVGSETDPLKMNHDQQVAYGTLREAARIAHENGWDTQAISREAVKAAAGRYSDPEDAAFMLDRFLKKETAPTKPQPKQIQPSPQVEAVKGREVIPSDQPLTKGDPNAVETSVVSGAKEQPTSSTEGVGVETPAPSITPRQDWGNKTLSQAVRAAGGIKLDVDTANRGELARLSQKEGATTGLVNNKGTSNAETMALRLAADGYRGDWVDVTMGAHGPKFDVDPNKFLEAVENDQRGITKSYSGEHDFDFEKGYKEHVESQIRDAKERQTAQRSADRLVSLLEGGRGGELFDKIAANEATPAEQQEFRALARKKFVRYSEVEDLINEAKAEGVSTAFEGPNEQGVTPEVPQLRFGPGAANVGDVPAESPITQLSSVLKANKSSTASERVRVSVADRATDAKDALSRGFLKVKAASRALYDAYVNLPAFTNFKRATGDWLGANQRADHEVRQFIKQSKKSVPNALTREGMLNWIEADGDLNVLQQRVDASSGTLKRGYEAALKLTEAEKTIALNIQSYYEARLQEGIDAGILDHGVERYVNHIWKRENPISKQLQADIQISKLQPNFKYAKQRVFGSDFEGEQTGYKSLTKDVFDRLAIYDQSFNRAVAARGYIKSLQGAKASDGRPLVEVSGSGAALPKGAEPPEAFVIRPRSKPEELGDYKSIDHPALRKWKWVAETPDGPILLQGDMLVHPEAYRHLKNVLSTSAFRQNPIGRAILTIQSTIKQTMLGFFSTFHQVQEETHALGHRVNLANLKPIDFNDPIQMDLVNRGLMVADHNAMSSFSEGLSGGNLTNKIPILGSKILKPYQEWLFQDHIPTLKMNMALHAFERNMARYGKQIESGKITRDQVLELTAKQGNAAFGELNYRYMGRNPTFQDALRTFILAPDFLEARAKFVGQALKPYGREQVAALGLLAMTQFITARVVNKIIDDDYHWDRPFAIVYKSHEFAMRTVPGDIVHLITDPRSFFYNRMSPGLKTATIAITGRNDRGQKIDAKQQIEEFLKSPIPINLRRKGDDAWWESFMNSMGVTEKKYRTPAEQAMLRLSEDKNFGSTPEDKERFQLRKQFEDRIREGDKTALTDARKAVQQGTLRPDDVAKVRRDSKRDRVELQFRSLGITDAMDVFEVMTDEQKNDMRRFLRAKQHLISNLPKPEQKAARLRLRGLLGHTTSVTPNVPMLSDPLTEMTSSPPP